MKAAVLYEAGEPIQVVDFTSGSVGPHSVRSHSVGPHHIRVRAGASGLCHSDVAVRAGVRLLPAVSYGSETPAGLRRGSACPPDAFNRDPMILEPGESLDVWMRISWELEWVIRCQRPWDSRT